MMYCEDCRSTFLVPNVRIDRFCHYWLDDKPEEKFYMPICPECGSSEIEECPCCDSCGTELLPEDLTNGLCPECFAEARH